MILLTDYFFFRFRASGIRTHDDGNVTRQGGVARKNLIKTQDLWVILNLIKSY